MTWVLVAETVGEFVKRGPFPAGCQGSRLVWEREGTIMMTFGQAIGTVFRKYADFDGRASRPEFWWFVLFSTLVSAGLSSLFSGLAGAWFFAVLLPSLAVSVRRLRDAGFAWPMIFLGLIPVVGIIILIVLYAQRSLDDQGPQAPNTFTE
jgi:hypothetical protein